MTQSAICLKPGTIVVFEGLDKAGKSTQLAKIKQVLNPAGTTFAHMPSGFSAFSASLYALLEDEATAPVDPLARQLAHLACHSEAMPNLLETKLHRALVLDRWWWSTLAYGWYGRGDADLGISEATFRGLIEEIWTPIRADAVFLFLHAYAQDDNNVDGVAGGYQTIAEHSRSTVIRVPELSEDETHEFIVAKLERLGLVAG